MTLSDLKRAAAARQNQDELQAPDSVAPPTAPPAARAAAATVKKPRTPKGIPATDGRTKMLGARVPLAIHREFQQHIFTAQEHYPDLTIQEAVPALIRLLRDEKVWNKFMAELGETE